MPSNGQRGKYWCFTVNNPTVEEKEAFSALQECMEYLIVANETGENGTPHLQGYVEFKTRKTMPTIKRISGFARSHLEKRRGTSEEASEYCRKDGDFAEFGTISTPQPGRRTDLESALEAVDNGATDRELWQEHAEIMVRYERAIQRARVMRRPAPSLNQYSLDAFINVPLEHDWTRSQHIWGPPGIGKTEYAKALIPNALFVSHMDELAHFNESYGGIIFDDMNFDHLPRTAQIHIVDQDNPRAIHIRYVVANIPAHTKKIFLSNNVNIFLYDAAINRRIETHQLVNPLF